MSGKFLTFLLLCGSVAVISGCTADNNIATRSHSSDVLEQGFAWCTNRIPEKVSETRVAIDGVRDANIGQISIIPGEAA